MRKNISLKTKNASRIFKRKSTESELSDDYYFLWNCAVQTADECKKICEYKWFSGLFDQCTELCRNGILPSNEEIISFFGNMNGIESVYLSVAVRCVLIEYAAKAVSESDNKLFENSLMSLRQTGERDFEYISERLFDAEDVLCADPSGYYLQMDAETKCMYRRAVAEKSAETGKTERETAEEALRKAEKTGCHIGKYIMNGLSQRNGILYLLMEIIMPVAAAFSVGILTLNPFAGILSFFPLWEILRYPIQNVSVKGIAVQRFPRLSVDCEKVKSVYALVTVSVILPAADNIKKLEKHLEHLYLSNCINNIKICCLADFKEADMPAVPEDKVILNAAISAIERLNKKYSGGFVLAARPRKYSKTQDKFIGKERKRGAITELVKAIKGNRKGFSMLCGDTRHLDKVKYIIALDSDTDLVFDSAVELIAITEHPLNRPVINNGRVTEGYGILVPDARNRQESKKTTVFSLVMAGAGGITAYDTFSCERYQQLFGESIFCGKGLIDVDTYFDLLIDSFPDELVLSHDIVEGSYLRAGFLPDIQITESFPSNADAFYKRLHRWIRGDWQNIRFIFGENALNFLSKYKMFDNLMRSISRALCLLTLLLSAIIQGDTGVFLASIAIFSLGAQYFFACLYSVKSGVFTVFSRLYFSHIIPEGIEYLLRGLFSIVYSARESVVCVSAAVTALWRQFITRRKLLEWQTASQSEASGGFSLLMAVPSIVFGVFLVVCGLPVHRLAGLMILADIPLTLYSGKTRRFNDKKINEKQRERLLTYAASMWNYFDELCTEEYNYLPPDNVQFMPVKKIASRTSPTNIGMMLVSVLAARDFGFIDSDDMCSRLNKSLDSIDKLKKYKGNLFNWYDTQTLETAEPEFVSSVDSGNFLCCITALKEGLKEYKGECKKLEEVIRRTEKIIDSTDISVMYNPRRRLFHTGITPESGEKSESYYDMFMSEARMMSYFAVARRQVPEKHWGSTARVRKKHGRYTGLASWTGTMFEFFMPYLFLPSPNGSLSREALCFCLYCQRKSARNRPFGVSESAYHSFDGKKNYKYKAHGIQSLAIKRGMDKEYVVSPYSSFLTLPLAPKLSMRNISRFLKMRMYDKYGFFEAVDFTSDKNKGEFSVVKSYMAHHTGMSLISVANLLNKQCMQRRFMSDSRMNGAKSLLKEKI